MIESTDIHGCFGYACYAAWTSCTHSISANLSSSTAGAGRGTGIGLAKKARRSRSPVSTTRKHPKAMESRGNLKVHPESKPATHSSLRVFCKSSDIKNLVYHPDSCGEAKYKMFCS